MPMWAARFLEISAGSTSMWMILAPGAHSLITVDSDALVEAHADGQDRVRLLEGVGGRVAMPCIPGMPTNRGWVPGNPPRPIRVVLTGIPVSSARRVSSTEASPLMMPPPA